jgi:DNA polymerase III delta prime subunit
MTEPITQELLQTLIEAVENEAREARGVSTSFTLGKGTRIATASHRPLYAFNLVNPPRLQEESRGRLSVKGAVVECSVISRRNDGLDVETFVDLGNEIESATLTVDRSELLSVLAARLESVSGEEPPFPFHRRLAGNLLDVSQIEAPTEGEFIGAPEDLTSDQQEAFRRALRNETTFLWGPPGTGKTVTLSAIAFHLFAQNKRILLVSHTNRAVDGIVLGLCKRIVGKSRVHLPEGSIVRVGQVSRKTLQGAFGPQISLEQLAESHQRKVRERVGLLRKDREACARELEGLLYQQGLLAKQGVLQEELVKLQKLYGEARSSESSMATVLRVLRIRYGTGDGSGTSIEDIKRAMKAVTGEILGVASELEGVSADEVHDRVEELRARDEEVTEAIRDLESLVEDSSISALQRARVVACTATQAVLRGPSLGEFDVVIVDEASMLPLPYAVFLAGLAKEKVVVGGDFRQLPPISLSNSAVAREWFARDLFEVAGIVDLVDRGEDHPSLAMLTTQFRGHEALSSLINGPFYGGKLVPKRKEAPSFDGERVPEWIARNPVVLIDSSSLAPYGHVERKSKGNLTHAVIVRSVCGALRSAGLLQTPSDVGVIAPYRAQVSLLEDLLEEAQLSEVAVGTVHRFQGAERETIILDLTESDPHTLSSFLGGTSLRDTGSRLLNVALSRAQARLIVVANLSYLRAHLSERHLLQGVLADIEQVGGVVDVREVVPDVVAPSAPAVTDPSLLQRFDAQTFLAGVTTDMREARASIVVGSPLLGERSAHVFATVVQPVTARGVTVEVITGDATTQSEEQDLAARILEGSGITVRKVSSGIPCGVVVDGETLWLGTTSPLRSVEASEVCMARTISGVASLSLVRELERGVAPHESVVQQVANS